jgi:hypothetical protein
MEQNETMNRIYSYLFYGIGILCIVCGIFFSDLYLIALTSILLLVSAVYMNSGHIVNNFLIRRSSIIEIYNGYRLSSNLDSAVKKVGNGYYALSVAIIIIEKTSNAGQEIIKNLVESIHEPFEFAILLREADRKRIIEGLEVKRRMKEIALSRTDSKLHDKINGLKREIDILGLEIENIRKSGKALEVVVKLSSFARSEVEVEAAREASSSIRHIADAFSASLGVGYELLKGEELLDSLEVRG